MNTGELHRNPAHGSVSLYTGGYGLNMYLMLNVHYPYLHIDPGYDVLNIPTSGGKAVDKDNEEKAIFYSDFDWLDGDIEMVWIDEETVPDWLSVTKGSHYAHVEDEEFLNYLWLEMEAPELPAGLYHRSADIKIYSYNKALDVTFTVIQEDNSTILSTQKSQKPYVVATGSGFELSYSSDFNKAVIYNLAGQSVDGFELPKSGKLTIPSNAINKGVYIIQFIGKTTETVKIVR